MLPIPAKTRALPTKKMLSRPQIAALGLIHAGALWALFLPSWPGAFAALTGHFLTGCLGISLGYHRLLTHRAFQSTRALRYVLASFGVLAFQGGPLRWAAMHRAHHRFENLPGDPHAASRGFLWSHILWATHKGPNGFRFRRLTEQVPDLASDGVLAFLDRHALSLNAAAFGIALAALPLSISLWLFPLRIVAVWHCTWLVNSAAHGAGSINGGASRNLQWLAFLTYGEGFHANHHARPADPDFAKKAWGDGAYAILRLLFRLRLASRNIKAETA